jgi:hypothetical protein
MEGGERWNGFQAFQEERERGGDEKEERERERERARCARIYEEE